MEFTSFCTLFGSSVAFPIIHPSIGVFVIRLRRNQFQILRSLLFTFQAENWTTSGGVEELCEKGQTSTHTHHTTPPPSQRNFSGGKLSGSNRLRERETLAVKGSQSHWRHSAGDVCRALANRIYGQGTEMDVLQGSPRCCDGSRSSIRISRPWCSCSQSETISYSPHPTSASKPIWFHRFLNFR